MLSDKYRLWMTICSLESIPSIDNRLLYADVLNSLNNNIYTIKQVQVPDLYNVYERNYNDLKQLLFNKYLKIIKDTEAGLADLIIQDLNDKYQNEVIQTFNIYTMYGGGDDGKPKMKPPPLLSAKGAPSFKPPPVGAPSTSKVPTPPPPPPPPPPALGQVNTIAKDIKNLTTELDKQDPKLDSDTRRERREDLLKIYVRITPSSAKEIVINTGVNQIALKDIANEIVKKAQQKGLGKDIRNMPSVSVKSRKKQGVPDLAPLPLINTNTVSNVKKLLTDFALEVANNEQRELRNNITQMVKETDPATVKITNLGLTDKEDLKWKFDYIGSKESVDKIIKTLELPENQNRPEFPLWRQNYVLLNTLLEVLLPSDANADSPRKVIDSMLKNIGILNYYHQKWTE